MDDHLFKEEEMGSVGAFSTVSSQIGVKCLNLARIGGPDILWSVNKLPRAVMKWTKACDRRLERLISYIHHTCDFKQYCYVGNTAQQCRSGLFQDSDFAGDLEDSKSTSSDILCIFGSRTFANKLDVQETNLSSHCSTEAEVISLNAGLRMDGIPAHDLWDSVTEVFSFLTRRNPKNKSVRESRRNLSANTHSNMWEQIPTMHANLDLTNIDHVPSSVTHSGSNAMLYVSEDNEAVIQMIIKGRSHHNETCVRNPQSCFGLVV